MKLYEVGGLWLYNLRIQFSNSYLCIAGRLIAVCLKGKERKVRTPQGGIAGNARRPLRRKGQVQQKVCTGKAVVKSGKLYAVKCHVNSRLRVSRPM